MKNNKTKINKSKELRFAVLATDVVLLTLLQNTLHVRLVPVTIPPHYNNTPALPGGLILPEETAEDSVKRHLKNKGNVFPSKVYLEQLYAFSGVTRDPRGRVVSVAYLGLVPWEQLSQSEQSSSQAAAWVPVHKVAKLAYDHNAILAKGLERLTSKITYSTLLSKLLPKEFTLTDFEQAYESILGKSIDKRNFRKKISKLGLVTKLKKHRTGFRQRPAQLFSFASKGVVPVEIL